MKTLKFGGKFDLFLRERDLTSGEASRLTKIPEKTVERIRAGHSAPCAAHLVRILKALKISISAIDPRDLEEEGIA